MSVVEGAESDTDAKFYCDQQFSGQKPVDVAEVRVGDGVFSDDDRVFVGTDPARCLPVSCQKILPR
jgi:hypothetical protein